MLRQKNQLFIKRVPPKKIIDLRMDNEWIPMVTDYQSFESIQKKSCFNLTIDNSKNPVITLLGLSRKIFKTLITIFCVTCCALQIKSLAGEYLKYEVIESSGQDKSKEIYSPGFSFCFNVLGLINVTQLFNSRPDVNLAAKLFYNDCTANGACPFNDKTDLILDLSVGPKIVFSRLKTSEIIGLLPKLDTFLVSCDYLTSNLTVVQCEGTFFQAYLYSQKICYEFLWNSLSSQNQSVPVFPASSVQIPGFLNTKLLMVEFNLTLFKGNTLLDIMAHNRLDVPWNPETGTKELIISPDQYLVQRLSYRKITRFSLPEPYQSNCTDYSNSPFKSQRHCLQNCSLTQFLKISNYYPWYYAIRTFDDHFLAYSSSKRETYQPLITQLSEKCSETCGTLECIEENFEMISLTSTRQFSPGLKFIQISIYPPSRPDTLIRTAPVQTYEYFFASIGGVIGVWFGFSAFHTLTLVNQAIPKLYGQLKLHWVNQRNQVVKFKPTIKRFKRTIK